MLASIVLSAPVVGCTGTCPDNPPLVVSRHVLSMPDTELQAAIDRCKQQQDCEPLCALQFERFNGYAPDGMLVGCQLEAVPDPDTGADVVQWSEPQQCIGGRRPAGYHGPRRCDTAGAALAQQAELEAASVRAFADLHADLCALGAPAALRRAAIAAAADEVRHAQTCERLARSYGTRPARRSLAAAARRDRLALALDNLVEGCVRETYGAVVAGYQGRAARDPHVRRAMSSISRDEARHAALSWRIHAWLWPQLSADERVQLRAAAAAARSELDTPPAHPAETREQIGVPDAVAASAMLAQLDATVWAELG